ncbi:hypothetical protein K458DRAFT_455130 [Lentithecium fluviatile CBS 122367]|uniref:Uncharacterized protein n=1 Tax=Lentithecium fluviatile CBS 122367 TaxID=1168545 RepID=A0A6G1JLC4_9PLEO|nr:hypothetical protein K458DRAFT_455130 [Lentithecium fluviatile CBS 122367]
MQAIVVIHSRLPSCIICFSFPDSYMLRVNTRLVLDSSPIKNPFSSILYVCRLSISYCSILRLRSSKYSVYLKAESALKRLRSRPNAQCKTISSLCRATKRSTQFLPHGFWAIWDAKFRIIGREGGSPRSQRSFIYFISCFSCVVLSSLSFYTLEAQVPCTRRWRRDSVNRLQPYNFA